MLRLCNRVSVPAAMSAYRTALALGYLSPSAMHRALDTASPGVLSCTVIPYRREEALELLEDTEYLNANAADESDREEALDNMLGGFGDLGDAFLLRISRANSPCHWSDMPLLDRWNDLELAGLYLRLRGDFWASWCHGIVTPYSFLEEIETFCPFHEEPGYFNDDPHDELEGTATAFDVALREVPRLLQPLVVPWVLGRGEEFSARKRELATYCPPPFRQPLQRLTALGNAFQQLVTFIHLGPHVGDILLHCADEETAMQSTAQLRLIHDWGQRLMECGASTDLFGVAVVRGDYLALVLRLLQQADAITDQLRSLLFTEVDHAAVA